MSTFIKYSAFKTGLHHFTFTCVYLCQELAKMIGQICKKQEDNKVIPMHNATHTGRPARLRWGGLRLIMDVGLST